MFKAWDKQLHRVPAAVVVAVDLGFSTSGASCGVATAEDTSRNHHFGIAVTRTAGTLAGARQAVLILEAPLSFRFDEKGRPASRGKFEDDIKGTDQRARYWSQAPGVGVAFAALFFLRKLRSALSQRTPDPQLAIHLVEGFVTRKAAEADHRQVAAGLRHCFCDGTGTWLEPRAGEVLSVLDLLGTPDAAPPILSPPDGSGWASFPTSQ